MHTISGKAKAGFHVPAGVLVSTAMHLQRSYKSMRLEITSNRQTEV